MNRHWLILIIVTVLIFTANIGGVSVYILDEAKNAGCAMEMHHRGDWIVPTFNDALRTDKPPLHYYFMRAAYAVGGVNPFTARIFSALMGILTVLAVYFFTSRLLNPRAGFMAALMLACSIQLAIQFHLAVPDPYLIFFLTTGLLSFCYAYATGTSVFYYLFYVCISLATLAKGPVAPVFAGLIVTAFLLVSRRFTWQQWLAIKIIPGALIFLLLVVPWYVAVGVETHGVWLEQFFFKHNVGRFTSTMEGHRGFPLVSVLIMVAALIPFSFFAPQALKAVWANLRLNAFVLFCFIAMTTVVVFFAFSRTILPSYPEPSVPFFAILLGFFFDRAAAHAAPQRLRLVINGAVYLVIAVLLPVATAIAVQQEKGIAQAWPVALYMIVLPLAAVVALGFLIKHKIAAALYTYCTGTVVFLLAFFYIMFPAVDRLNPVSQSTPLLAGAGNAIVYYKDFNPAYIFALGHPVNGFDTPASLAGYRADHHPCYIITQKRYWDELPQGKTLLYAGKDLFERQETILVSVE